MKKFGSGGSDKDGERGGVIACGPGLGGGEILLEKLGPSLRRVELSPCRLGCSKVAMISEFSRFALVPFRCESRTDSDMFGSILGDVSLSVSSGHGKVVPSSSRCLC